MKSCAASGATIGLDERRSSFLDDLRKELALRYLEDTTVTVGELALQLGFSDTSNFVRAFRKWTGKTPGQYRDER